MGLLQLRYSMAHRVVCLLHQRGLCWLAKLQAKLHQNWNLHDPTHTSYNRVTLRTLPVLLTPSAITTSPRNKEWLSNALRSSFTLAFWNSSVDSRYAVERLNSPVWSPHTRPNATTKSCKRLVTLPFRGSGVLYLAWNVEYPWFREVMFCYNAFAHSNQFLLKNYK